MISYPLKNQTSRADVVYPALAFVLTLIVYTLTLCPTVYVGDSGEFITNAATLGINHPTGYPLYTVLARLAVMILAFWTPAVAVNFFSALCASITVACLFFILKMFTSRNELAFAISLLYGFSYTLWSRATTAEVYTLNAFFVSLAIYFLLQWYCHQQPIHLVILAYLVGLGLSQHVTGALLTLGVALLIVLKQPKILSNIKLLLALVGAAVLGFTVYFYLPFRSLADPPIDWGNPENLRYITGHFFPKASAALFGEIGKGFVDRIEWILTQAFTKEFWYLGVLAVFGLIALSHEWRLILFFLSAIGINSYFTIIRKLPFHADFDAYFMPSYIIMAILICCAVDWVWRLLARLGVDETRKLPRLAFALVLLLFPLALVQRHYHENDRSNNWFGYDFGMNLLSRVPQNAVLFTVGDEQTFISWYFKYVEKQRPDLVIIDRNLLGAIWGGSHMYNRELSLPIREEQSPERLARQIIALSIEKRPVYVTPRLPWEFMTQEYDFWHSGMVIQLLPKGTAKLLYEPTEFSFHPDWTTSYYDDRCKLIVKFYYKEFVDNAKFWYSRGDKDAALREIEQFQAFPYPKEDEDNAVANLLLGQIYADRQQYGEAMAAVDSAEVYGPADWRVHEVRGNISYLLKDTARAIQSWRVSLAYNPNNQKLKRNIEILSRRFPAANKPPTR